MDWTDLIIDVPREDAQAATDVATAFSDSGIYVEDYAQLEEDVWDIAHVDLIEQALLDKPKDRVLIHIYLSPEENAAKAAESLSAKLLAAGVTAPLRTDSLRQEDWETAWKQYYHPLEVGTRLLVAPSWEQVESPRRILRLDPGMAFGTGTHETTFLCLEALDALVQGGETVLDVGTGSGILAIAALLLGAKSALGIDIDAHSARIAGENAARNGVEDRFTALEGDLAARAKAGVRYNIVTANIIADAIVRLAPDVPGLLAPGGVFLASGIIDERRADAESALHRAGFAQVEVHEKGGWVMLAGRMEKEND